MNFHFPVTLYLGPVRQGQITFRNVSVKEPSDYTCDPINILVLDEAKDLFRQIRQAPLSGEGMIGKFVWQI